MSVDSVMESATRRFAIRSTRRGFLGRFGAGLLAAGVGGLSTGGRKCGRRGNWLRLPALWSLERLRCMPRLPVRHVCLRIVVSLRVQSTIDALPGLLRPVSHTDMRKRRISAVPLHAPIRIELQRLFESEVSGQLVAQTSRARALHTPDSRCWGGLAALVVTMRAFHGWIPGARRARGRVPSSEGPKFSPPISEGY